ncbi:MAG: hypothetical protein OXN17_08130 [Candidatus Poribacteria bacterium]|nr:hypothetical protein [Candidatus Poribacteria bacterium]MDE0503283.1 hypothetical protein [Candidatus Poribacteria bacterium]
MSTPLPNNIALSARQKESKPLKFDSGEVLIAAGVTRGNNLPETIVLQMRFGDESGAMTEWRDTDVVLSEENGWQDTFSASPFVEFKVVASATGATVHTSLITQSVTL